MEWIRKIINIWCLCCTLVVWVVLFFADGLNWDAVTAICLMSIGLSYFADKLLPKPPQIETTGE